MELVDLHAVGAHIKGHIRHVQEVVGKVLLDQVTLVAAANDEVIDAVVRVNLHDVPQNRHATNFYHRLGFEVGLLRNPRPQTPGQDDCFHI